MGACSTHEKGLAPCELRPGDVRLSSQIDALELLGLQTASLEKAEPFLILGRQIVANLKQDEPHYRLTGLSPRNDRAT